MAGSSTSDFARQLAERDAELNGAQTKKFRASAAPKGSRLAAGYQDRTQFRTSADKDEKATRVKALEDMVKLGQIEESTFEKLRDEIIGGDVKDVHLVKGLDYKLLKRIRRGEDVLAGKSEASEEFEPILNTPESELDVEDEFEKLEEKEIKPLAKEEKPKKGDMAPPAPINRKKRTRDDILRELKAARAAAIAEAKARQPALGAKFKKLGEKREQSRIEVDEKGREVLIVVDGDGNVKRKIKKTSSEKEVSTEHGLLMPDKDIAPLGMEIMPTAQSVTLEEADIDIFEGVGTSFNPLGDSVNDEGDCSSGDDEEDDDRTDARDVATEQNFSTSPPPPTSVSVLPKDGPRNYFKDSDDIHAPTHSSPNPLTDPAVLAALKKASTIHPLSSRSPENEEEASRIARHKKMLESRDRDAEDMDMGFGGSRFGDEEDADDGKRIKLSVWGDQEGDDRGGEQRGKEKRRRGQKKRKGDKESAADVMKVLERRKAQT